ncbi:MAG: serine/threonine protein kinase [Proteobacteria bacterium]|nr:serine/threonine protein kinase [Pseudomonadota bacterium]
MMMTSSDSVLENIQSLNLLQGVPPDEVKLAKRQSVGGVSEIWLATHPLHPAPFVVKYSKYTCAGNDYIRGQFEREYEASCVRFERGISTSSTHIACFDVDAVEHPYLYIEYFPSTPLNEIMQHCFEWRCVRTIFARLSKCLRQIHTNGIVHRDIKPTNILISKSGELRIIDFALSTIDGNWHRFHEEGMALGTPLYMSPEQAYGKKIMLTSACDWYAVGVILYYWMTGTYPFQGKNAADTMKMHCYNDVPQPQINRLTSSPASLPELCCGLLSKDPNSRFSAVNRFREILK